MNPLTEHDKWWIREMILRGDNPVKRFQQATTEQQNYGLATLGHEAARSWRMASVSSGFGGALLLVSPFWPGPPIPLMVFGVLLLVMALIAGTRCWGRRRALRRLLKAGVLSPEQLTLPAAPRSQWQHPTAP